MSDEFSVEDLRDLINTLQKENKQLRQRSEEYRARISELQNAVLKQRNKKHEAQNALTQIDKHLNPTRDLLEFQINDLRSVIHEYQDKLQLTNNSLRLLGLFSMIQQKFPVFNSLLPLTNNHFLGLFTMIQHKNQQKSPVFVSLFPPIRIL